MPNVRGAFLTIDASSIDSTTAQELIDEDDEFRTVLNTRQMKHCLTFLQSIRKQHDLPGGENRCWGHIRTSKSELNKPYVEALVRAEDRIGYYEAFQGWRTHFGESLRMNMAMHNGVMIMIDLETGRDEFMLFVLADATSHSRLYRVMKSEKPQNSFDDILKAYDDSINQGFEYMWTQHAWMDVFMNKKIWSYYDDFKVVAGSLGFGNPPHIWWEHGNEEWETLVQFRSPVCGIDCHFWLEDTHGHVWDVLRPCTLAVLLSTGIRLPNETFPRALSGVSKERLRQEGIHYLPAPEETQPLLIQTVRRINKNILDAARL